MADRGYKEILGSFSEIETKILEGKCKELPDQAIWESLYISSSMFYIYKSNMYAKLGLDRVKSYKARALTLKNEVCPVFYSLSANSNPPKENKINREIMIIPQNIYNKAVNDGKSEVIVINAKGKPNWWKDLLVWINTPLYSNPDINHAVLLSVLTSFTLTVTLAIVLLMILYR